MTAACPQCEEPVLDGEDFCEACGRSQRSCAECDAQAIDADGYCEHCGLRQPAPRDHIEVELPGGVAAGASDRGRRYSRNEDALALATRPGGIAAVVCDGVGSSPRPDDASETAAQTVLAHLTGPDGSDTPEPGEVPDDETVVREAIAAAAGAVAGLADSPAEAPSCTCVVAVTDGMAVTVGWVGDSRAYWLGGAETRVLTGDDSWAAAVVSAGLMTEDEAEAHPNAHVITAWLGADADEVSPHVATFEPSGPGTLLVCSDGLWNYLPAAKDLAATLDGAGSDPAADPLGAARVLVRHALEAGGRDNITVAVVPVPPSDPSSPSDPSTPESH